MRLLESQVYRGKQIRVYVIYPDGPSKMALPSLGVRIDGKVFENRAFLKDAKQLGEALQWGRSAVDCLLGGDRAASAGLLPAPV